jgi:hypothetical protein
LTTARAIGAILFSARIIAMRRIDPVEGKPVKATANVSRTVVSADTDADLFGERVSPPSAVLR